MAVKTRTTNLAQGYNYRVYVGCDTDDDGNIIEATADRIIGGWAPDAETAKQRAQNALL